MPAIHPAANRGLLRDLLRHPDVNSDTRLGVINATFKYRETVTPADEFEVLTSDFAERHLVQWNAFVKKNEAAHRQAVATGCKDSDRSSKAFNIFSTSLQSVVTPRLAWAIRAPQLLQQFAAARE